MLFFVAGFYFLTRKVLKGNDTHAIQVQLLFSTIFMISCSMFSLVLFEVLDVLSHARWWGWKFNLVLVTLVLILVLPTHAVAVAGIIHLRRQYTSSCTLVTPLWTQFCEVRQLIGVKDIFLNEWSSLLFRFDRSLTSVQV